MYSLKRGIPNFHFYGLFTISLLNFPFHFFLQVELFALKLEMIQLKMTRFSFLPNGSREHRMIERHHIDSIPIFVPNPQTDLTVCFSPPPPPSGNCLPGCATRTLENKLLVLAPSSSGLSEFMS